MVEGGVGLVSFFFFLRGGGGGFGGAGFFWEGLEVFYGGMTMLWDSVF